LAHGLGRVSESVIQRLQVLILSAGKANLVGDLQLYNTAAELTRIMGHKNASPFFNDPSAANPQTGQLLHPPPALSSPDPKLLAAQARAQIDAATSAHQALHRHSRRRQMKIVDRRK